MKGPLFPWRRGASGSSGDLGLSLPIERGLRRSWLVLAACAGALAAGLFVVQCRGQLPEIDDPLGPRQVEELVANRLARVEVPPWDPGVELPETPAPEPEAPEPPPPWRELPAWDATPRRLVDELAAARADLEAGRTVAAITRYLEAAAAAPGGWYPRYHAGVALLERGDFGRAAEVLDEALDRLQASSGAGAEPIAARISTHLALGAALLPERCVPALNHLKRAVGALDAYVGTAGVLVYRRTLPFPVEPAGLDNYAVWLALVRAYDHCAEGYPREYMATYREGTPYLESEFSELAAGKPPRSLDLVRSGPFPDELAACIEAARAERHGERAHCWALSNLNRLYYTNRESYRRLEEGGGRGRSVEHPGALARLAFAVARALAGDETTRARAPRYLEQSRRLAILAGDRALEDRALALGRHLAPLTEDYTVLAGAHRGRAPEELELDERSSPEEVLGVAWHLVGRWRGMIEAERTPDAIAEIEAFRRRAGPHGPSLVAWREELRERLRSELVAGMRQARANDHLARATALRDIEAPYLGAEWRGTARHGWRPYGRWAAWAGTWLLAVALLAGVQRFVIYPYLMHTTDFYRLEFARRQREAKEADRPFTRRELEERGVRPT